MKEYMGVACGETPKPKSHASMLVDQASKVHNLAQEISLQARDILYSITIPTDTESTEANQKAIPNNLPPLIEELGLYFTGIEAELLNLKKLLNNLGL